jgi:hypothetical protein
VANAGEVFYINRSNRKRHVDPDCRALRLTREGLEDAHPDPEVYPEDDPPPTYETRGRL